MDLRDLERIVKNPTGRVLLGIFIFYFEGIQGNFPAPITYWQAQVLAQIIGCAVALWGVSAIRTNKKTDKFKAWLKRLAFVLIALITAYGILYKVGTNVEIVGDGLATSTPSATSPAIQTLSVTAVLPKKTVSVTTGATETPFATDTFNDLIIDGSIWRQLNQCTLSDFQDNNTGEIRLILAATKTKQCWLEAVSPERISAALLDFSISSSEPFNGYAGIRTSCGSSEIEVQVRPTDIRFIRTNFPPTYYARLDNFTSRKLRLTIGWLAGGEILIQIYDMSSGELINPNYDFDPPVACTDPPSYFWVGGYSFSGEFVITIDNIALIDGD